MNSLGFRLAVVSPLHVVWYYPNNEKEFILNYNYILLNLNINVKAHIVTPTCGLILFNLIFKKEVNKTEIITYTHKNESRILLAQSYATK